jgi:preprotein translocase subunit SecE
MARNRQRARDRKARQQGEPGAARPDEPGEIHHEDTPGGLDHLGDVEEFDATLIEGADGEPTDIDDAELEAAAVGAAAGLPADQVDPDIETFEEEDRARKRAPSGPKPGGNRVLNFLRASWAELQRVQWPDRRQVAQATAVVLGFVAIAGAYLGVADAVAQKIVDYIL